MTHSSVLVQIAVRQDRHAVPEALLIEAVQGVLRGEDVQAAEISIAVVADSEMQDLNRQFLDHDYPTDVLSFLLEESPVLEGELILSADTAAREAPLHGLSYDEELLLYAIHGTLHLVGYDDHETQDEQLMRRKEALYLTPFRASPEAGG